MITKLFHAVLILCVLAGVILLLALMATPGAGADTFTATVPPVWPSGTPTTPPPGWTATRAAYPAPEPTRPTEPYPAPGQPYTIDERFAVYFPIVR